MTLSGAKPALISASLSLRPEGAPILVPNLWSYRTDGSPPVLGRLRAGVIGGSGLTIVCVVDVLQCWRPREGLPGQVASARPLRGALGASEEEC